MAERPAAAELLALARETLLRELADAVPAEKRYSLLMVANAMAVAAREIEGGDRRDRDALAELHRFYGGPDEAGGTVEARRAALERRLAQDIRRGAFDGDDSLRKLLLDQVRARLAVSNPKALAR
jgi:hypothetical protein